MTNNVLTNDVLLYSCKDTSDFHNASLHVREYAKSGSFIALQKSGLFLFRHGRLTGGPSSFVSGFSHAPQSDSSHVRSFSGREQRGHKFEMRWRTGRDGGYRTDRQREMWTHTDKDG